MLRSYRERFNRQFTEERHAALLAEMERRCGVPIEFRLSETPCFVAGSLISRLADVASELVDQLLNNPDYRRAADAVVPPAFRLTHGETLPTFVQVDFGLIQTPGGFAPADPPSGSLAGAPRSPRRSPGSLARAPSLAPIGIEGRLVELQAFPSLYGFQLLLAETITNWYGLDELTMFPAGLDRAEYLRLAGHAILGGHDPADVVLMEIMPEHQKTRPDFAATEQLWGVRAFDLGDIEQRGKQLFRRSDGRRVRRVYNRVIPDELDKRGAAFPFDTDVDVEWAGGPDWFFRVSKFSIPWLRHPWVPRTQYLNDVSALPGDRESWLLKPLFSFAGGGIIFGPTDEDLAAIPAGERSNYILQERVAFTPVIDTPHGRTQVELRIMMVRDGDRYRAVMPLARMGRGRMMGVDHNKGLSWVGAAAVLIDPDA